MKAKPDRPAIETAERADFVRGAATRAEHAARRLLRRTHSLARRAARRLPGGSTSILLETGGVYSPTLSAPVTGDEHAWADEYAALLSRLDRAEHAAAWLRARLRAERLRRVAVPVLDADALAADLTRDLTRLRAYDTAAIERVVNRVLSAHGLPVRTPIQARRGGGAPDGNLPAAIPEWPRARQEALAARVLTRAPDVSHPRYVYQALVLVAGHGGGTLAHLIRASRLDSAMGKRRLRLAIDALVALGALTLRDGVYTLNLEDRLPRPPRPPRDQGAPEGRTGRSRR